MKQLKAVNKVIRKEKIAYWKKVEEEARREREARNKKPINQFIGKGLKKGVLYKAATFKDVVNPDGSRQQVNEEIIIPVYDLDDCIRVTADGTVEYDLDRDDGKKHSIEDVYKKWEENYKEAEEERERKAEEQGKIAVDSNVEPPRISDLPPAPVDIKISLEDVRVALIKCAAKSNKSIRKYELTRGHTNEVKKELFAMVKVMYSIDGDLPEDAVKYINNLDKIIEYAKATLVANELATTAISKQIEENGEDAVNVDEAVEMVKTALKDYFEEVYNIPLPADLQKHDFIEDDTIIEAAGYDTVEGLAQRTMDDKLGHMTNLIRVRSVEDEGSVSPESEKVISELREKMRKSFRGESIAEQEAREDALLRLFHADRIGDIQLDDNEEEEGKEDASLDFSPEDIEAHIKARQDAAEEFPTETMELVAEEAVAAEEAEKEQRAMQMETPERKGLEDDRLAEAAYEVADTSDEETIGDELEEALRQYTESSEDQNPVSDLLAGIKEAIRETSEVDVDYPESDSQENIEPPYVQEPVTTEEPISTTEVPASTAETVGEPTYGEEYGNNTTYVDGMSEETVTTEATVENQDNTSSAIEDLLAGINGASESEQNSAEGLVYEPISNEQPATPETEQSHSNKYGFYDDRKVTESQSSQPSQPVPNATNISQTNNPAFGNEPEPVTRVSTPSPSETRQSESDFFKNRQGNGATQSASNQNNQTNKVAQPTAQPITQPNSSSSKKTNTGGPRVIKSDGSVQKSRNDGSKAYRSSEPVAEPVENENNNQKGKNPKGGQMNNPNNGQMNNSNGNDEL